MDAPRIIAQRYRIGRKLGEGGMGTVYEAEHVTTGRRLAVKLLEQRDKLPPEAVDRFERESRAPAKIRHPNVVEVIDAGTEPDGTPYLAMELLEGETLDDVVRREKVVQPGRLSVVMDQLLSGLDAMHGHGFVHRDLKPANIFLADEPGEAMRVKLLDFGIAKALGEDSRTKSGYVIGTPAYMAPEQMRNARNATPRSDLWSVGVMLYECLAGHRPFRGETFGLLAAISGPVPAVPLCTASPRVPVALGALVDRLLSKDMSQRPASALSVRESLLPLLATCPRLEPVLPPRDPDDDDEAPRLPVPIGEADTQASADATAPWHESVNRATKPARGVPTEALSLSSRDEAAPRRGFSGRPVVLVAVVTVALVTGIALAMRAGSTPEHDHRGAGHGHGSQGARATSGTLRANPELAQFVDNWRGTVSASQGNGPVDRFYAESVQFGGATAPSTREAIHRYWQSLWRSGGNFDVDSERSDQVRLAPTLNNGVTAACVNLPFATGPVFRVQAHATELRADRGPSVPCARLEGVYFLDVRRANGALFVCHEGWSMRDGICAACPDAPVCADGGAERP